MYSFKIYILTAILIQAAHAAPCAQQPKSCKGLIEPGAVPMINACERFVAAFDRLPADPGKEDVHGSVGGVSAGLMSDDQWVNHCGTYLQDYGGSTQDAMVRRDDAGICQAAAGGLGIACGVAATIFTLGFGIPECALATTAGSSICNAVP